MQCSISRPSDVTGHALPDACALSGHERDTHCVFSVHFDTPEDMVRFGRRVTEEGWNLIRERRAKLLGVEVPAGCGEDAP